MKCHRVSPPRLEGAGRIGSIDPHILRNVGIGYNEGRTESHEQLFFLHANWEQQTKESAVVDGTSCCVIL